MAGIFAKTEGMEELVKAFDKLGDDAMQFLKEGTDKAAKMVLSKTKQKAPVDDGDIEKSLTATKAKLGYKSKYRITASIKIGKGGMHAVPVELGHRLYSHGKDTGKQVEAKPFMRPAADEAKAEYVEIMKDAFNDALIYSWK